MDPRRKSDPDALQIDHGLVSLRVAKAARAAIRTDVAFRRLQTLTGKAAPFSDEGRTFVAVERRVLTAAASRGGR
jgi:hypothetical protein